MIRKILGIDLGTTNCKAIILEEDGKILGISCIEYPLIKRRENYIEQDPQEWWKAVKEVIKRVIAATKVNPKEIISLSISSQGISFVPVDKEGTPLYNAISWLDKRAIKQTKEILKKFSLKEMFHLTGKRVNPGYILPKLLWLRENEPIIFKNTHKFLMAEDYLIMKFTGKFITDHSLAAGTLLYDVNKLCWSEEIIDRFCISQEKLPEIKWSGTPIGKISSDAAKETGLNKKTLIVVGGQDQKCAALGAGIKHKVATISLGTASAITIITNKAIIDEEMRIPCFPFLIPGFWVLEGVISTAGEALKWIQEILNMKGSYQSLNELAQKSLPGSNGIFFLPYLAGISSPDWQPEAKACFWGLNLSTKKNDIIRVVMEGIGFEIKRNISVMEELSGKVEKIRIFGGGAKSNLWLKIISNITGKEMEVFKTTEIASLGVCILAGTGAGIYKNYENALGKLNPPIKRIKPVPADQDVYQEKYQVYQKILLKLAEMI